MGGAWGARMIPQRKPGQTGRSDFHSSKHLENVPSARGFPARKTVIKTPTSYFVCASFATTSATLSSIWFQPSI
jgi:hypothetical protein